MMTTAASLSPTLSLSFFFILCPTCPSPQSVPRPPFLPHSLLLVPVLSSVFSDGCSGFSVGCGGFPVGSGPLNSGVLAFFDIYIEFYFLFFSFQ